jgi:GH35 family endo-1,4-beta-xylanase
MPADSPDRTSLSAEPSMMSHRFADATVSLRLNGAPLVGREVVVAQCNHRFLFGCTGFEFIDQANRVAADSAAASTHAPAAEADGDSAKVEPLVGRWFDLFNFVTLPFYWGRFEPTPGRPDTERLRSAARWFAERRAVVKGHPLVWHTVSADWLLELSNAEIAQRTAARVAREINDFAGLIDMWDVINEVVIMPIFDKYDNGITRVCRDVGRIPFVRMLFDAARAANPRAMLLLNDFDMSAAYECLIEGLLEANVRIDALGLQSHMHQGYWGEEKTLEILERFSRYRLPLHFTETTLISGHLMPPEIIDLNDYKVSHWPTTPEGEARQAEEVVRHYKTLLSHPSVQAITYWGFRDGGWLNAPGGFVRADGTPKPSYDALRALVKGEWWVPPTTVSADGAGKVRFRGFLGEYEVRIAGKQARFTLEKPGVSEIAVDL